MAPKQAQEKLLVDDFIARAARLDDSTLFDLPTVPRTIDYNNLTVPAKLIGSIRGSNEAVYLGLKSAYGCSMADEVDWTPLFYKLDNKAKSGFSKIKQDIVDIHSHGEDLNIARWIGSDTQHGAAALISDSRMLFYKYLQALYLKGVSKKEIDAMKKAVLHNSAKQRKARRAEATASRAATNAIKSAGLARRASSEQTGTRTVAERAAERAANFSKKHPTLDTAQKVWNAYAMSANTLDIKDVETYEAVQQAWSSLNGNSWPPSRTVLQRCHDLRVQRRLHSIEESSYWQSYLAMPKVGARGLLFNTTSLFGGKAAGASTSTPDQTREDAWTKKYANESDATREFMSIGEGLVTAVREHARILCDTMRGE